MRYEDALQQLIDAGWEERTARAILDQEASGGTVDQDLVDRILSESADDRLQAGYNYTPDRSGEEPPAEVDLIQSAVEAQAQDLPLSDEERAALDDPSNRDMIIEAIQALQGEERFNYDWVYNNLQVKPGSLDSPIALMEVLNSMIDLGVVNEEDVEGKSDEEKATFVAEILARNGSNTLVQMSVLDWAQSTDVYTPRQEIDGVSVQDIGALLERGLSVARATSFGRLANNFEIDPVRLHDLWSKQQETAKIASAVGGPLAATQFGMAQTATKFKEGLELFDQSNVLAAIHVFDPSLATKLRNDPYSLDSGELRRALDYIGGEDAAAESGDPQVNWLATRLAGGYQQLATVPSDEDVKAAVQTLAASWNMTGSEDVVAAVSRQLIGNAVAQARASLPNPFGPLGDPVKTVESGSAEGYVRDRLKGTQEYQELFAHLAPGESEEEYAGRFDRRTQAVLGDDVVSVSRNAMRSGNINTPYQQALLTDVGESSTRFQEILARNAEVFRELL